MGFVEELDPEKEVLGLLLGDSNLLSLVLSVIHAKPMVIQEVTGQQEYV